MKINAIDGLIIGKTTDGEKRIQRLSLMTDLQTENFTNNTLNSLDNSVINSCSAVGINFESHILITFPKTRA